jgi:hypothetical protein
MFFSELSTWLKYTLQVQPKDYSNMFTQKLCSSIAIVNISKIYFLKKVLLEIKRNNLLLKMM